MSYIEIVIKPNFEKAYEALTRYEIHKDAKVALECLKKTWSKKVTANELIHMMGEHKYINGRNYRGDNLWGEYVLTLGYYIQASCHVLRQMKPSLKIHRILRYHHFRLKLDILIARHLIIINNKENDLTKSITDDDHATTRKYYKRIKRIKHKRFGK